MENEDKILYLDDIAKLYAKKSNDTIKNSKEVVNDVIGLIKENLIKGNSIRFTEFGLFEVSKYPNGTIRRNPSNNEIVDLSGRRRLKFKYSDKFKNEVTK